MKPVIIKVPPCAPDLWEGVEVLAFGRDRVRTKSEQSPNKVRTNGEHLHPLPEVGCAGWHFYNYKFNHDYNRKTFAWCSFVCVALPRMRGPVTRIILTIFVVAT